MKSRLLHAGALWSTGALAISLPVLLGRSLNAHGDLYTYVFVLLNLIPIKVVEWASGQELPHHARWAALASVVFWGAVGVLVAMWNAGGTRRARTRA
jgi:hypothetical protein